MKKYLTLFFLTVITACDTTIPTNPDNRTTDQIMYDLSKSINGYVWYKKTDVFLPKSTGSGHNTPLMRTRFNTIAAEKLDGAGKVKTGSTFPEGSIIVKELAASTGEVSVFAIMYKSTKSTNADANGWNWAYLHTDGSVRISSDQKGAACISCHAQSGHIDAVLMNKFFP